MPPYVPSEFPKYRIVKDLNGHPREDRKIVQCRTSYRMRVYANHLFYRSRFEINELEAAFREFLKVSSFFNGTDRRISLVLSFHDYSQGLWIEVGKDIGKPKLAKGEDFILQSTHFI